jgi:TonB family protein
MHNRAVRTRALLIKLAAPTLLLALNCLPASAQTTEDAIKARLIGQPLYLRGFWMDEHLKFNVDGQPVGSFRAGPFTEAGIDVHKVKLSPGQLHIEGQRSVLEFLNMNPTRISLKGKMSHSSISIDIQAPPGSDFSKALDAIFAPDPASLVPTMPLYWQSFARKHFLAPNAAAAPDISTDPASATSHSPSSSADKPFHIDGSVVRPVVLSQQAPQFSSAARALKYSGTVVVYLWVMADGTPSHLSIVKPAGLGLDEEAILAVSKYKFKPATKDGKPITVDLFVDVNFQILQ